MQSVGVSEKLKLTKGLPLAIQHLFAMFGASVLVPFIFGINPSIVLLMNGIGTIIFILITKGKSPAFLGSSFAFLATGQLIISKYGINYAYGSFIIVGICGMVLALIIHFCGSKWINKILPTAAMGPVVALIGLELAHSAATTANIVGEHVDGKNIVVFLVTLLLAILGNVFFKGFFKIITILIAIIGGFVVSLMLGMVDVSSIIHAPLISVPQFSMPQFNLNAIIMMLPVLLVTTTEHIGHQVVTGKLVGRDLLTDPGLDKSLFADNFSTTISGCLGSVPTTTYGENIGVMAMSKVFSVQVIFMAAILSMVCAFSGNITALISAIPGPVIGGVSFLLYGMIGASGIRMLVDQHVNYDKARNLILTAIVLITGLSGVSIKLGDIVLQGMVLACIVGIGLGLIFYLGDKLHLTSDRDESEFCE